jgi:4-carboxymuconolactone decarboxylase
MSAFSSNPDLRKRGLEVLEELYGGGIGAKKNEDYRDNSSDFADMTLEWAIGGLFGRPGLDMKTRELIALASCVPLTSYVTYPIAAHAEAALKVGATKTEIYESVLQCLWYSGSAGVAVSLGVLKEFFEKYEAESGNRTISGT